MLVEKFIANLPTLSNWGEQVGGRASLNLPQKMMPLNATVFIFFKMSYKLKEKKLRHKIYDRSTILRFKF